MKPVPFTDDGEAICQCGDYIYRITPTDRIESMFLQADGVDYSNEDYEDGANVIYECNGCQTLYDAPEQPMRDAEGDER